MREAEATGLPRPTMAFQVGVTGHRALPGADVPALRDAAAHLFRTIRTEVLRLHAADQASAQPLYRPDPPVLRCIGGIAEGADSLLAEAALAEGWDLVAVLPFPREEFARDFPSDAALDGYRALLGRASAVSELDGSRGRGGEPYDQIGQQVVEQSDLILAVWDGLPPRGPGGTGDVVQRGLDRGVPVAVLPPAGPVAVAWRPAAGTDLPILLRAMLLRSDDGLSQATTDVPGRASWPRTVVRWFERAVLAGTPAAGSAAGPTRSAVPADDRLGSAFAAADQLAGDYAARYRAAGLLRYALVLPATAGAFLVSLGDLWIRPVGYLLQFGSLAAIIWFSTWGGWDRSQARFIAYRALAEYLRSARLLRVVGTVVQPPGAAAHDSGARDWTAWYGRAILRGAGLPPGRIDAAAIARFTAQLREQTAAEVAYLRDRAERDTVIARRLKRIGVCLVAAGIACAVAHAALVVGAAAGRPILWTSELALVLPALAPVFLGLLGFGEYGRLATRYRAVAAELAAQLAVLDQAAQTRTDTVRVARRIAAVMLAETADWQSLIRARTLSAY